MPRHQVAEACETEHSKGGPMRFSSGSLKDENGKFMEQKHLFLTSPTNAFCFKKKQENPSNSFFVMRPKLNEFVNPVEIYEGSIILSHPWATIPWPPGTFQPPPSRTLQPKSPLSAGKGSLLWIGTKAKELGCKLKWPGLRLRLQRSICATVVPANSKHTTKRSTSTC